MNLRFFPPTTRAASAFLPITIAAIVAACQGEDPPGRSTGTAKTDPESGGATAGGRPVGTSDGSGGPSADEIQHVLSTGQSNAIGFASTPPLSKASAFTNLMFDTGVITAGDCDPDGCRRYEKPASFVPLSEGDRYFAYAVETTSSGLADGVTRIMKDRGKTSPRLLLSVHGRSGNTYECLRKNGCGFLRERGYSSAFDEAIDQVTDARAIAGKTGARYRVGAVTAVHGESDHYANAFPLAASTPGRPPVSTYADALVEWQRDYEESIRAVTGQTEGVPLLVSQMSNWNDRPESAIPRAQLEAHGRAPGKVILVGPTYMLPFAEDCIHFTNEGERRLGEYFAKAYARAVVERQTYEPLRPIRATRDGDRAIRVVFHVPTPPLVLDTERVKDPGNFGFVVAGADGSPRAVASVALSGPDAVTITLTAPPGAEALSVRYAATAQAFTCPGPETGPRGNLRDSDKGASNHGYELFNWAVHFSQAVQ